MKVEHTDKGLRVAAVEALGGIGRQEGVFPALFVALSDREVEVRATAMSALKRVGKPDKADIEGITKFLDDPTASTPQSGCRGAGPARSRGEGIDPGLDPHGR